MMAAAHKVKCAICGEIFDLNKIQGVRHGARRYAHQTCYPDGEIVPLPEETPEYKSLKSLEAYIIKLFKIEFVTPKMKKQIKEYKENYNYTYSGMEKTLFWFYEIKKNPIEKANQSLGIIPYVYNEACNYYYNIYLAQNANKSIDIEKYKPKIKRINIISPRTDTKHIKLFNLEETEE